MNQRTETRYHNVGILENLGFRQIRHTKVFKRGDDFILSPAVAENTTGGYWFDISKGNLESINDAAILLVRIVPDLFILIKLADMQELFVEELMHNRGKWRFHIEMQRGVRQAKVFNRKKPEHKVPVELLTIYNVEDAYRNMTR